MIRPTSHRKTISIVIASLVLTCSVVGPAVECRADEAPVDPSVAIHAYGEEISQLVKDVYARRGERTIWFGTPTRLTENATAVLSAIKQADTQGLDPRFYGVDELENALARVSALPEPPQEELSRTDALMTTAVVMYTHDLAEGRLDPHRLGIVGGEAAAPRIDVAAFVDSIAHEGRVDEALATLAPRHAEYEHLRTALAHYRKLAAHGPWTTIGDGPTMKPGELHAIARIDALALRLRAEELIDERSMPKKHAAGAVNAIYGDNLVAGVRRFQSLRGLAADGVIGARTLAELNRTPAQLVRTIELNMERWRWAADDLGAAHVRVNIPAFQLAAYQDNEQKLQMPIIVGQTTWGTPLFSDRIRSVILNPYWNVPQSIARKELLAKVFADRSYLSRENMEIVSGSGPGAHVISPHDVDWAAYTPATFPYRLRQKPGPLNPLGRIKFLFPNRFNVYLHDTPNTRLFTLPERALSHGCVRIAHPLDLAEWLFRDDPKWSGTRIADAIKAGSQEAIPIRPPVPLHIFYFTAVASADGKVEIYKDLYGIDASLDRSLRELHDAWRTPILP